MSACNIMEASNCRAHNHIPSDKWWCLGTRAARSQFMIPMDRCCAEVKGSYGNRNLGFAKCRVEWKRQQCKVNSNKHIWSVESDQMERGACTYFILMRPTVCSETRGVKTRTFEARQMNRERGEITDGMLHLVM